MDTPDGECASDDDMLQARQGGTLYPVGKALRATYDANNHETLSRDVTRLMLALSRVPYERMPVGVARPAAPDPAPVLPAADDVHAADLRPTGLIARMWVLLRR